MMTQKVNKMTDPGKRVDNNDKRVSIRTNDEKTVTGYMNILGYDRLSDYLLQHRDDFFMVYNSGIRGTSTMFVYKIHVISIEDSDEPSQIKVT